MPRAAGLRSTPVALSIAGSDSGAGAGIQADLLTFSALGVFGTTAITCLTAQNPARVSKVHAVPAAFVTAQIEAVCSYFPVRAAKTGMLFNAGVIDAVAAYAAAHRSIKLVVDPVMVASSGAILLQRRAITSLTDRLFPLAAVITPNLEECAVLLGRRPESASELSDAARSLAARYDVPILLKGGHIAGSRLTDVLAYPSGRLRSFAGHRITGVDTHGSGCTLSAAIAAGLALGRSLETSIAVARRYLRRGMSRPQRVGPGCFIAH